LAAVAVVVVVVGAGLVFARRTDPGLDLGSGPAADGELDELSGVPVLAGAYRAEGDLADGLAVPQGTVLLGEVLPDGAVFGGGAVGQVPGWRALLLVHGDLSEVLDDLTGQATDLGLEPYQNDLYSPGCTATDYQPPEGLVECREAWQNDDLWVDATIWRGVVPAGFSSETARPVSLLTLQLGRLGAAGPPTSPAIPATATAGASAPSTVVAPRPLRSSSPSNAPPATTPDEPLPGGWSEPPGPGQWLGDGIAEPDGRDVLSLRLPDGAHAVIAPWPTGGNAPNYAAIVAVTGDPEVVLADLDAQIDVWFDSDVYRPDPTVIDGALITLVRGDQAGGSKLDLTAFTIDDHTWITVSTGYD
jgi:hypothetical protein